MASVNLALPREKLNTEVVKPETWTERQSLNEIERRHSRSMIQRQQSRNRATIIEWDWKLTIKEHDWKTTTKEQSDNHWIKWKDENHGTWFKDNNQGTWLKYATEYWQSRNMNDNHEFLWNERQIMEKIERETNKKTLITGQLYEGIGECSVGHEIDRLICRRRCTKDTLFRNAQ